MYIEKIGSFMNFLEKRKVVGLYDRNVNILAMRERDLLKTHLWWRRLTSCRHARMACCFQRTRPMSCSDQGDYHYMCESH